MRAELAIATQSILPLLVIGLPRLYGAWHHIMTGLLQHGGLADDVLDITGDAARSGKAPGTDLREGVATLPTFYVNASSDPADARLKALLARPLTDDAEHAEALGGLIAVGPPAGQHDEPMSFADVGAALEQRLVAAWGGHLLDRAPALPTSASTQGA